MWHKIVQSGLSFENNISQMMNKAKPHWMIEDIVETQIIHSTYVREDMPFTTTKLKGF